MENFFKLFHQTPEEHAQRLHQLAEKIGAGWFPSLKALYLYTLSTEDLIVFLDKAFPIQINTQGDAATVSSATKTEVLTRLEKLDFRTDNWNDALLDRLKVLAKQFPALRFGNGLGMHDAQVTDDNQLLRLGDHVDFTFWDEKTMTPELRDKILQWMQAIPDSPMALQARNITGYKIENKHHGQAASFIREMRRGYVSGLRPMTSVT